MCQRQLLVLCDYKHPQSGPKVTNMLPNTNASFFLSFFLHVGEHYFWPRRKFDLQETFVRRTPVYYEQFI